MKCKTIGVDLAKNIFQVCGVNDNIKPQFNKKLSRAKFVEFMAQQPPTRVVLEACYSSHYWGRTLTNMGHDVNLIPAQHVTPFVRGNKNDRNDALAIVEASLRPHIRFVPIKTTHQQEISALHTIRERLIKQKTAASNQARGLLSDFGVIFDKGRKSFLAGLTAFVKNEDNSLRLRTIMADLLDEYQTLVTRITNIEKELMVFMDNEPNSKILLSIPGIGMINTSAILSTIDKGQAFNSPREFAVWLGLTPLQHASGTTNRMGGISKRGNRYLRKQLIHGARTVVNTSKDKTDQLNRWCQQLRARKSYNKTVVAMAHRLARLIWLLLQRQECYRPQLANHAIEGK